MIFILNVIYFKLNLKPKFYKRHEGLGPLRRQDTKIFLCGGRFIIIS